MNILVTGAQGQLGQEMQSAAATVAQQHHFFYTDSRELDITHQESVQSYISEHRINIIVNCAAYTNVDQAEDNALQARAINATGVGYLAQAAKENDALLIHISTDYVFGGTGNLPYQEEAPPQPLAVYGSTKLEGEQFIATSGCRNLIIRTAWLYSSHGKNFVTTMCRLMKEKPSLNVVFDQVGTPTFAGDLADTIITIINASPTAEQEGIYHYSNEGVCSWYDFAIAIRQLIGSSCNIQPCHSNEFPSKVTRPAFSVLDKSKIRRNFGIRIPHWQESLAHCMKQLSSNPTT